MRKLERLFELGLWNSFEGLGMVGESSQDEASLPAFLPP